MFTFTGFTNPVLAAKAFLQSSGVPIDIASFDRVAGICGDRKIEGGFLVYNIDDLQRLCEIGQFVILQTGDMVSAMLPSEFRKAVS